MSTRHNHVVGDMSRCESNESLRESRIHVISFYNLIGGALLSRRKSTVWPPQCYQALSSRARKEEMSLGTRLPCRYEENQWLLHVFLGCTLLLMGKNINQLSRLCFHIVPPEQSSSLDDKCMVILNNIVCHYQTVAPLSHSSLVPRPPIFTFCLCSQ